MDDIQTRLKETSQNCLVAYESWDEDRQDKKAQEALHAAIHELRKVSSRLEIDLAVSERNQSTAKPLPIPAHKSSNKNSGVAILDSGDVSNVDNGAQKPIIQKSAPRRRRAPRKPQS
ncbi:MAG: hypothetical protein COB36_04710 [Alphaproteobacteria bacterium]|nr:MAG: hypothetical protein COB36_04710 [Alphaproteobacteria bacterium]